MTPAATSFEMSSALFNSSRVALRRQLVAPILSCPNTIQLEKSYSSGGVVAEESGKDARTPHHVVPRCAAPEFLEIPVASRKEAARAILMLKAMARIL